MRGWTVEDGLMRERVVWRDEQGYEHALEGPPWDLQRAVRDMEAMGWTHRLEQVEA